MTKNDYVEAKETAASSITVEKVQQFLGSLDGRFPLLMAIQASVESVRQATDEVTSNASQPTDRAGFSDAVDRLDEATRPVAVALAWIAAWGQQGVHEQLIRSALQRLTNIADQRAGIQIWSRLRRWPALVALAAIGTAAVDVGREDILGHVLARVVLREPNRYEPAAIALSPIHAIDPDAARQLLGRSRACTPVDDMIGEHMATWLVPELIDSVTQANDCYDRYQFLAGLAHFDERIVREQAGWAPAGSFKWRHEFGWTVPDAVASELEQQRGRWPLLAAGLFGSDVERARTALDGYRGIIRGGW
jgi:hypothetical protein